MMSRLVNTLPWLLPTLVALGVLGFAGWTILQPKPPERITGDLNAAKSLAEEEGAPLFLVVDSAPH